MRVTHSDSHLPSVERGAGISVFVDGRRITAYQGETIAAVLLAEGIRVFRRISNAGDPRCGEAIRGEPRGLFCGMGICYDCLVIADGSNVRACMTPVAPDMVIETGAADA